MSDPESPPSRLSARVIERIVSKLDTFLADPGAAEKTVGNAEAHLGADILSDAWAVLTNKGLSYRDGLIIQAAWGLEETAEPFDHTQRGEGGRSVAQQLGKAHGARHIAKVNDAFENIGKNTPNLARGNLAAFDQLLRWMNGASVAEREALFEALVAAVALTARPVLPMPDLARTSLTFVAVSAFLDDLLNTPSGGAYEQFAATAFLGALVDQFGLGGVGALGVKTKNINASDASAGTAADVQIMRGGMIEEAFEVSANDWRSKVDQAIQAARGADLPRSHILAANGGDISGLAELLKDSTVDVSVMELKAFLRVLCGILKKPAREDALRRLYDNTDRLQSDVTRTNRIVELLRSHSLTA